MAHPSAIETLIELATKDSDEAAKRLGRAVRTADECEQKLNMLLQYRDDYEARLRAAMAAGLTAQGYRNFQLFIEKLEQAIGGQQQLVNDAKHRIEMERTAWQGCERKRMSYDTLAARAIKEKLAKENKRDQKENDEHAARQLLYKR